MAAVGLLLLGAAVAAPRMALVAPEGEPVRGAEVPLWVVVSEDGQPLPDQEPRLAASAGAILRREGQISPGVWEVQYRAPDLEGPVSFALGLDGVDQRVDLALLPPPVPTLQVAEVETGLVGQPVSLTASSDPPPSPDEILVVSTEGRSAVSAVPGGLRVSWTPGGDPFPRAVPLGLLDRRAPDAPPAWTVVLLRARPRVPVQTEPGSSVSLRVGGRGYGPFVAGADGVANAVIEVRPGEDVAEVTVVDAVGNEQRSTLSLGGEPRPGFAAVAPERLVAGRDGQPLSLFAVEADGRPWRGAAPRCTSSTGESLVPARVGSGQWRVPLPRPPDDAFFDVRVECNLADRARVDLRIPIDPGGPARLVLRVWPETLSADNPQAQVRATLEDRLGERVDAAGIVLRAELGTLTPDAAVGPGATRADYSGIQAVSAGSDTLTASWNLPPGGGAPWSLVLAAPLPLAEAASDGARLVHGRALDQHGQPIPDLEILLSAGGPPVAARTDSRGWASATVPVSEAPAVLEARAGRLVRRIPLFPGQATGPDPMAPDLMARTLLPIKAGRVREVFLTTEPAIITAGGEGAKVRVRLLDRGGNPITDTLPHLSASMGTISAPVLSAEGTWEANVLPPPGIAFGEVLITASGGEAGAGFQATTTLEVLPQRVTRAPGLDLGVIVGSDGLLSPWAELELDQRLPTSLPLFGRLGVGTYGAVAEATDEITGTPVRVGMRLFPISLATLARTEGRRRSAWIGAAVVICPYRLDVRFGETRVVEGPGLTPPGFSAFAGTSLRLRGSELQLQARYLFLTAGNADTGWQGPLGGVVATLGYRLLY